VRTALADKKKVAPGGLIHVQESNFHSRAKLVLKKVNPAHWPAGTDAYEVVLSATNASGAAKLWDAEEGGAEVAWPARTRRTSLTADRTYWLEGQTATKALHAIRIDAGVQAKRNGDWVRLTVVQIQQVKPAAAAAWNEAQGRYYINLDNHSDLATRETNGRTIQIQAQLTERIPDLPLYFMLAPDQNNRKAANWGLDMPSSWHWDQISGALKQDDKDPANAKIHRSANTSANGLAKAGLRLSRFGGDRFQAGAFIWEDHHLGRYRPGHPTHGVKRPRLSATFQVWRKLWYQLTRLRGADVPAQDATVTAYAKVKVDLVAAAIAEYESTDADLPAGTLYPDWMVGVGNTGREIVVAGAHNSDWLHSKFQPDASQPRKVNVVVCRTVMMPAPQAQNAQVTVTLPSTFWAKAQALFTRKAPTTEYISEEIPLSNCVLKPPLRGGKLVVSGTWKTLPPAKAAHGVLADEDIIIQRGRRSMSHVRVRLPAKATPTATRKLEVKLTLQAANGPHEGASNGDEIIIRYVPGQGAEFNDTLVHEIGHSVNQTPSDGRQPSSIPNHPAYFPSDGGHCWNGYYDKPKRHCCVMYSCSDSSCIHRFCDMCAPYLLAEDMSSIVEEGGEGKRS